MDGFNVLNTVAGGIYSGNVVMGIFFTVVSAAAFVLAGLEWRGDRPFAKVAVLVALLAAIASFLWVHDGYYPTRYEITLKPGAVIDAARYEIVEQRGEIYVIQERKHP